MRRLSRLLPPIIGLALSLACNEHPVEHCVAGQGITIDADPVPRYGPATAPVEVVMFGDIQCPATAYMLVRLDAFAEALEQDARAGRFQLRFHHFPIESLHSRARAAAIAAAAAHRQGNDVFWELLFRLHQPSDELSDDDILAYAARAGLDLGQFAADLSDPEVEAIVDRDLGLGRDLGVRYTPSVFLCGMPVIPDSEALLENLEFLTAD